MAIKTYFGSPHFYYGYNAGDTVEGIFIQQCTHAPIQWFNISRKEMIPRHEIAQYRHNKGTKVCRYCDECNAYVHPTSPKDLGKDDYDYMFGHVKYIMPDVEAVMAGHEFMSQKELQEITIWAWFIGEID